MNIKYYGVKGGAIDHYFLDPDYYINQILRNEESLLTYAKFRDPQGDIDWIEVTPYEKGVVYDLKRRPYGPGTTRYENETGAKIIVTPEEVSYFITKIDHVEDEYDVDKAMEDLKNNNDKVKELIGTLGSEIGIDKIRDDRRSKNRFKKIVEARQEKTQREQFIPLMKKSLKDLRKMRDQKRQIIKDFTPYQNIAKDALMNWNGLTLDEANNKVINESVDELEGQVYAKNSIGYAISSLSQNLGLTEEEIKQFYDAVINGPINSSIFTTVSKKARQVENYNDLELSVLSAIHDGWVIDNSNDKTFQKKMDNGQLRQYAPLELIGWNEAKSDLLFLEPILKSISVPVKLNELEKAYYEKVNEYANQMSISDPESLLEVVSQGKDYYPVLPEELSKKLIANSEIVAKQIMDNWNENDIKSIEALGTVMEVEGMQR